MKARLAAVLLALAAIASPAAACRIAPRNPYAVIHAALPAVLPPGAIVAEVDFEADTIDAFALAAAGIRVRVRRMVEGRYDGGWLILRRRPEVVTNCDGPGSNGAAGLIVAIPSGYENGVLVADPILVPRADGFRLPDRPAPRRR